MSVVAYVSHHCLVMLMAFLEGHGPTPVNVCSGLCKPPLHVILMAFLEGHGPTLAMSAMAYMKGHDTLIISINVKSNVGLGLSPSYHDLYPPINPTIHFS